MTAHAQRAEDQSDDDVRDVIELSLLNYDRMSGP